MLAMFHISSQVRSLVTGLSSYSRGSSGCREAVPVIIISWMPRKGMTVVWMPTTALASTAFASPTNPLQGQVPGVVENVAELLDFSAAQAFQARRRSRPRAPIE